MLYLFLVDTGTMMTFDINLALESVANLKVAIARKCKIPTEKQVLLISGGDYLDPATRVCSYSTGTDTSPIFLFSKAFIEAAKPPNPMVDYGPDSDVTDRVEGCLDMQPTLTTLVARSQLANDLHQLATEQLRICEMLVHDQHLQQQGWAAVVANLDDMISAFSSSITMLLQLFDDFMDSRVQYLKVLANLKDDIELLNRIPVLPALLQKEPSDKVITLLNWISSKDDQCSLEQVAEHCKNGLQQFDENFKDVFMREVEVILKDADQSNMKEIRGLEERLFGLDTLMSEAKKVTKEQHDLKIGFQKNQQRAANYKDESILPDLCKSHRTQLQLMLQNHQRMRDIRRKCTQSKKELCENLHMRLKWVMFIEKGLSDADSKILIHRENIRRLKIHFDVIEQIHLASQIYLKSVVEVVRRRTFSQTYMKWASKLSQESSILYEREIEIRKLFEPHLPSHFLQTLFPGMNEFPPSFATECPETFDSDLPNLSEKDVEYLRHCLPDLSDLLNVPYSVPMPFSTSPLCVTSSESSLERMQVDRDLVEFKKFEEEKAKFDKEKLQFAEEKQKLEKQILQGNQEDLEEIMLKAEMEHKKELETLRSSFQAEKQTKFNEMIRPLIQGRDSVINELKWRMDNVAIQIHAIKKHLEQCEMDQNEDIKTALEAIDKLLSQSQPIRMGESAAVLPVSELQRVQNEESMRLCEGTSVVDASGILPKSVSYQSDKIAVLNCDVGDVVLIFHDVPCDSYKVFTLHPTLHFLHTDCLALLKLAPGPGETKKSWVLAEVTDKEFCQIKKAQNRYNIPLNTRFFRVKAKPWTRIGGMGMSSSTMETRPTAGPSSSSPANPLSESSQ